MQGVLIIIGVWLAGYSLRLFGHPVLRKTGALLYLAATYLAGYLPTGAHWAGAAAASTWFLLPWVEIILRVRRLRLPIDKQLKHRFPPSREEFPHLGDLTREMEAQGFEQVEDTGWDGGSVRQFLRLFYHAETRVQAAVCLSQQPGMSVVFTTLTTRTATGLTLTTTDYPFSNTMRQAPGVMISRVPYAGSAANLAEQHAAFVSSLGLGPADAEELKTETLTDRLTGELRRQIDHNLATGILRQSGGGMFRYSWRGCFFLWRQFVKDLLTLA